MKNRYGFICMLVLFVPGPSLFAQNLTIPVGQQGLEFTGTKVPQRGMTQSAVEVRFGSPMLKADPVGIPPISHWEYASYHVYFENDRVLHTVLKPAPAKN